MQLPGSDQTFAADLSHNALIAITGDDARAFLHGQFTNDVEALGPGTAQWNGWCSAKGRLLTTFLLARGEHGYLMMLPAEIAEPIRKRLGMFVLRSKVKLEDVSGNLARFGVAGPEAAGWIEERVGSVPEKMHLAEQDGSIAIRLDDERFVVFARAPLFEDLAPREAWDVSLIRAGIPIVLAATQDAFVPQMANYELIGGVSFKKGCYPGQEIVARTQYRGILKRRMALAHVEGAESPQPGDPLYSEAFGEQAAGQVANAAPSPGGGFDALVVAQIESLERKDLRLKSPQGLPLELRPLPYPVVRG